MGKYNLGKSTTTVQNKITKDSFYLNESKCNTIVKDIDKQLDSISTSLHKITNVLNRTVSIGVVKGAKGTSFKAWAKKSKSQADNALKLKEKLDTKYSSDVRDYPIRVLNDRIAELERKIAELGN